MGRQKRTEWVADFETTTTPEDCRVWGWGLVNIETGKSAWDVEMGHDIHSFIKRVEKMPSIIYFHNLKFDGFFLLDWLLRRGYSYAGKFPRNKEFTALIDDMGTFYTITVVWESGHKTEFRDSYKKLPYKASVVAKAFGTPETKGTIDYHAHRPVGHVMTRQERHYLANDVLIISKALKVQLEAGMTKLTVGADALHDYKKMVGGPKHFERMFPVLSGTMDSEIRQAYRGGFTYADPRFAGKIQGKGRTYDVNSLYPSVMYDSLLPYGTPVYSPGLPEPTKEYPLYIVSITFTAKIKKNHIPCIQVKGNMGFSETEYLTEITEPVTLACTNVDLALWEDHYDMDILSYNGGWLFHGVKGVFCDYIDKWMKVKTESEGGQRELAKLHLNSLYGKYATNPDVTGKYPVLEDNIVKLKLGPEETRNPVYTAMGVFITAYARNKTIRAAQENYPVFAYCDTDSLHLLTETDPDNLWVDPKALGAWKFEYAFERALFVRAKTYIEDLGRVHCKTEHNPDGTDHVHDRGCEHETHVAGMPVEITERMTIETFIPGKAYPGKKVPQRVPGGVVLIDVDYTLPAW